MELRPTPLAGAFLVETNVSKDGRGSFYRAFCQREFTAQGLPGSFVQSSISRNRLRGTVRGLHFQAEPKPEAKLVRCIRGTVWDVIVDLRRESPTFCRWFSVELSETNALALYIPAGLAHGFQTLEDASDLLYLMTEFYEPSMAGGVNYRDPSFGISWPLEVAAISDRDRDLPKFT